MFARAQAPPRARQGPHPGKQPSVTHQAPSPGLPASSDDVFPKGKWHVIPKAILKVYFVKKHVHYSTFHSLIMLCTRDQSGRNLSVLGINGFCGYLNPRGPLECNSLGKNSFPVLLPTPNPPPHTHITPIIQKRVMTQHRTCMRQLPRLFTF